METTESEPVRAPADRTRRYVRAWEIWLSSFIGSTFLMIADLMFNRAEAVTPRVGTIAQGVLGELVDAQHMDTLAFLVMAALGLGLCFVYRPATRFGAFGRGSSVIAVLVGMNVVVPPEASAAELTIQVSPGAQVSTCEPRSYGPFGLGTAINGDAKGCWRSDLVQRAGALPCVAPVTIGDEVYCEVVLPEQQNMKVWVQAPPLNCPQPRLPSALIRAAPRM